MPILRLLLIFTLLISVPAGAHDRLPDAVIRALKTAGIPPRAVAVVVRGAAVGSTSQLDVNAAAALNPASVMKLITTYAALELLGPAYTWKTEASITGVLQDGRLDGDLYLKGSGDPKLTFEQFWLLLRSLRARGLRDIQGDLILDRSRFAPEDRVVEFDDEPLRPYNVTPDALLLNFNSIRLQLLPESGRAGLTVAAEPLPDGLDILNVIHLDANACDDWKAGLRADVSRRDGRTRLILSGRYPAACGNRAWHLAVIPHTHYVLGVFRELWRELGGTFSGGMREAQVPSSARLMTAVSSPSLAEIVRDINKYSNNVMARQLFLTLGAEATNKQGAANADADTAVRAWLAQKRLDFPELVLENGSGLSRIARVSADSLARLLAQAWASPVMPEFIASLPLTAIDGTMKKRLGGTPIAGQAHVKTGTLDGVKTIAGYVRDHVGKWQIVVFLINHPNARNAQAAQDALLRWVYRHGS